MTKRANFGDWRKSSRSKDDAQCVEAGTGFGVVGVADTAENQRGPILEFTRAEWGLFLQQIKNGDHPTA